MFELGANLTARVGGHAGQVLEPHGVEEFVRVVTRLRADGQRFRVLGGGSNVIAADGSFEEPILLTRGLQGTRELSRTRWFVEAGVNLTSLCHRSARAGLHGLECCTGIPGTIGAAIRINAGGKYGTVAAVTREVTLLLQDGQVVRRPVTAEDFGYRHSRFFDEIVLAAELEFTEDDPERCRQRVRDVLLHKRTTQPLRYPSAGCIFRNPPGDSAGRLIDQSGLKGLRIGGAMVSELHANYIVNVDRASGDDFVRLIETVRQRVHAHTGVELELEIDLWREDGR